MAQVALFGETEVCVFVRSDVPVLPTTCAPIFLEVTAPPYFNVLELCIRQGALWPVNSINHVTLRLLAQFICFIDLVGRMRLPTKQEVGNPPNKT